MGVPPGITYLLSTLKIYFEKRTHTQSDRTKARADPPGKLPPSTPGGIEYPCVEECRWLEIRRPIVQRGGEGKRTTNTQGGGEMGSDPIGRCGCQTETADNLWRMDIDRKENDKFPARGAGGCSLEMEVSGGSIDRKDAGMVGRIRSLSRIKNGAPHR